MGTYELLSGEKIDTRALSGADKKFLASALDLYNKGTPQEKFEAFYMTTSAPICWEGRWPFKRRREAVTSQSIYTIMWDLSVRLSSGRKPLAPITG